MLPVRPDNFALMQEVRFYCQNEDIVRVPLIVRGDRVLGFVGDGASKPPITQFLVGGPFDKGLPAYWLHDWLYVHQQVERNGIPFRINRPMADMILAEALETLGMEASKRNLIWEGVVLGGGSHWTKEPRVMSTKQITFEDHGEHFHPLTALAFPSFNPDVDDLLRKRLAA